MVLKAFDHDNCSLDELCDFQAAQIAGLTRENEVLRPVVEAAWDWLEAVGMAHHTPTNARKQRADLNKALLDWHEWENDSYG